MAQREGSSSCQLINSPREAMVVIRIPTCIEGEIRDLSYMVRFEGEIEIGW